LGSQLLCDKSPGFVEAAKGSADLIARTVELSQAEAPDGVNAAQVSMLKDTAQQLLLLLGEQIDVEEDASAVGGGFIIKRVARRARSATFLSSLSHFSHTFLSQFSHTFLKSPGLALARRPALSVAPSAARSAARPKVSAALPGARSTAWWGA